MKMDIVEILLAVYNFLPVLVLLCRKKNKTKQNTMNSDL